MKQLAVLLVAVALSGCWSGDGFFATSEAVPAIPAGKYVATFERAASGPVDGPDFGKRVRIKYAADDHAIIENTEEGDTNAAILVKLGNTPGLYAVQANLEARIPSVGSSLYALVQLTDDGYQIAVPICNERRVAGNSRIVVSGLLVGKLVCQFNDRADLESALETYAQNPISWTTYRRLK